MLPFPPRPLGAHHVQQLTLCAALFASSFILLILSVLSPFQPFNSPKEEELAAALQRDLKPAGEVIAEALKTRDWSSARKRLAGILRECRTESAKVLEDAMQKAGEEAAKNAKDAEREDKEGLTRSRGGAEGETVMADERARGETKPGTNSGSFAPEGGGGESGKSGGNANATPRKPTVGLKNPDTPEVQAEQIAKAKAAFAKCLESHEDVENAFTRGDIGPIDVR